MRRLVHHLLCLNYCVEDTIFCPRQTASRKANDDNKSNVPMPSIDNTVAARSKFVKPHGMAMHSVAALIDNACWTRLLTRSVSLAPNVCWNTKQQIRDLTTWRTDHLPEIPKTTTSPTCCPKWAWHEPSGNCCLALSRQRSRHCGELQRDTVRGPALHNVAEEENSLQIDFPIRGKSPDDENKDEQWMSEMQIRVRDCKTDFAKDP